MFGVQLSYLGAAIGLLFPFSHFSQMRKATHFVVLGHIYGTNADEEFTLPAEISRATANHFACLMPIMSVNMMQKFG
jgi:hypothetical protein